MTRNVAIRLGTEGKAQVKADIVEIGDTGDATAKRWSRSFDSATKDVEAAIQRQSNAAAKLAMIQPQTQTQMRINDTNSTGFGQYEGSARQSAAAFRELLAAEEQLDARTRALVSAIDPAFAAQTRFNGAIGEAKALLDVGRISTEQFAAAQERAQAQLDAATGATARANAAAAELAAMQARVNAAGDNGFGGWEGSAERSASAFRGLLAAEEQLDARTRALVSAIDPAYAAQQRFDREIGEARSLISAGAISLDQYVAKLRIEQSALDAATGAKRRANVSTGELRAGSQQLSYQIGDVTASLASGTPIVTVFSQQIGQTVQAVQLMTGATEGFLGFIAGPWGAVLTGGVVLLSNLAAAYLSTKEESKKTTDVLATQVGTVEALDAANKLLNDTLGQSVKTQGQVRAEAIGVANANIVAAEAARNRAQQEINLARALLAQTQARSRQGGERSDVAAMRIPGDMADIDRQESSLAKLETKLGETRRSRDALVRVDQQQRAKDTADRADGDAKLLAAAGKTGEAERSLAAIRKQGREQLAAGTITEDAYRGRVVAGEKALDSAREADRKHSDSHEKTLARQASAMQVNAQASLDLAKAYLVGGDAALRAEAARKGLTDATRKGIDGDAQTARQLQVMIGEQVASGAKSVAQLREETEARAAVTAQVLAGTLPTDDMNQALQDEAALRPLLKLQTLAQGDALTVLTKVIGEYRAALADAHAEEAHGNATRAIAASKDRVDEVKASILDMSKSPQQQAIDAARRAAEREADAQRYTGADRTGFINGKVDEARASSAQSQASYILDTLRGQQDSLALGQRELQLAGANDNYRTAELEKLKIALDIRRRFPEMAEEDLDAILRGVDAQAAITAELEKTQAAMGELRDFGGQFVDTVLSEDTWSSWGNAGKSMIGMLKSEFVKLALLNPLKNLINGDSKLPTLTSALRNIGKLFGGGSGSTATTVGTSGLLSGYASGTDYAPGGLSLVGEDGPEVMNVPKGSRVTSAAETRRLFAGNDNGGGAPTIVIHANDAVLADTVRGWVAQGIDLAATRGAAGGAAMSEADARATSARKLGRRW